MSGDVTTVTAGSEVTETTTENPYGPEVYSNGSCVPRSIAYYEKNEPGMAVHMAYLQLRIGSRVVVGILALCAIYIAAMLIAIERKENSNNKRKKYARRLKIGRLVAACFTAVVLTYHSFSLLIEISGKVDCNWFWKTENALYWINISVIYCVLWFRQRAIYNEPSLGQLVSKMTSVFSFVTLFFVVALPLTNTLMYSNIMDLCYADYQRICLFRRLEQKVALYDQRKIGEFVVPVLLPLTLLGLFAWPLIQYNKVTSENARGQRSLLTVLRRMLILTIICLVTDMVAMISQVVLQTMEMFILTQVSAFSNLVCLVFSFADWKSVLFPMCRGETPDDSGTRAPSTQDMSLADVSTQKATTSQAQVASANC